jgi:putative sterol carrier protein
MAETQQPDVEQLAEAIKSLSDEELKKQVTNIGIDTTLQQIFDGMQEAFQPSKAQGINAVIQYEIETDEGTKNWTVEVADGKCTTSEGSAPDPRLTLGLPLVDFVRLIFGQADGTQLFMTGKLKLKGDMMFAMQMQGFFDRPGT